MLLVSIGIVRIVVVAVLIIMSGVSDLLMMCHLWLLLLLWLTSWLVRFRRRLRNGMLAQRRRRTTGGRRLMSRLLGGCR